MGVHLRRSSDLSVVDVSGEDEDLGTATAREWRRPGLSPLRAKTHPIWNQSPEDDRRRSTTNGSKDGKKMWDRGTNDEWNSQGPKGTWAQAEEGKGGLTDAGHSSRSIHAAQVVETSGGGWRVLDVGEFQVDIIPHQERRWGAGVHRVRWKQQMLLMERR